MVKISVVIPALNEEKYIRRTLDGLRKQTFKDFEVIVSDGGSTDRTREIAKKYAKIVIEKKRGMSAGRNAGAKVAKGDIIVFLDADTIPSENLLKIYARGVGDGIIAATGPIRPLEKVRKRVRWGYKFVSVVFVKAGIMMNKPAIVGSNFAIRRDVFNKVHGFNEDMLTYEDWDLARKIRKLGKVKYLNNAIVYTSARRVMAWGVYGYFKYHVGNAARYRATKKSKSDYPEIR